MNFGQARFAWIFLSAALLSAVGFTAFMMLRPGRKIPGAQSSIALLAVSPEGSEALATAGKAIAANRPDVAAQLYRDVRLASGAKGQSAAVLNLAEAIADCLDDDFPSARSLARNVIAEKVPDRGIAFAADCIEQARRTPVSSAEGFAIPTESSLALLSAAIEDFELGADEDALLLLHSFSSIQFSDHLAWMRELQFAARDWIEDYGNTKLHAEMFQNLLDEDQARFSALWRSASGPLGRYKRETERSIEAMFQKKAADFAQLTKDAAELQSRRAVLASSADYAIEQGRNSWYYGYYEPNSVQFRRDLNTREIGHEIWNGSEFHCLVGQDWEHPGAQHPAVKRWVATINGPIQIYGHVARKDTQGNGVIIRIRLNGRTLWAYRLAPKDTSGTGYDIVTTVAVGSTVDFVVEAIDSANAYGTTPFSQEIRAL